MISENLKSAVSRLQIVDVIVKAIKASLAEDFVPNVSEAAEDLKSFQTIGPICENMTEYYTDDDSVRTVVYDLKAGIRLVRGTKEENADLSSADVEQRIGALIEANFLVSYREKRVDEDFLSDACLTEFAAENVPFNVWPYWRELLQSACGRMGLPKIVLPAKRIRHPMPLVVKEVLEGSSGPIANRS